MTLDLSAGVASWLAAVELEDCVAEAADELRGSPGLGLEKVHALVRPMERGRVVSNATEGLLVGGRLTERGE